MGFGAGPEKSKSRKVEKHMPNCPETRKVKKCRKVERVENCPAFRLFESAANFLSLRLFENCPLPHFMRARRGVPPWAKTARPQHRKIYSPSCYRSSDQCLIAPSRGRCTEACTKPFPSLLGLLKESERLDKGRNNYDTAALRGAT